MIKKVLKENKLWLIVLLIVIILFSIIMQSNIYDKIVLFDYKVFNIIQKIIDNKLTFIFKVLTNFGDLYIPCVILVCILLFIKNKWYFILQSAGYLTSGLIAYLLKIIIARERPLEALIKIPRSFSFPSGHTLTSIVFYGLLCYLLTYKKEKNIKIIGIIITSLLIISIAVSRVYLGVHYFSDVIGGLILGIIILKIIINIIEKNFKEKLK